MKKVLKTLRWPAFRKLRERNHGAIFFGAIMGGVFAGSAFAQSVPTTIAGCEQGMKTHFNVIRNLNNDAINPAAINDNFVHNQCQKNSLSLKNQKEGDAASQKYTADGFGTDPMNGACQLSYWEIRSTYDVLQKEYHTYCEKVMELQELGKSCAKKDSTQTPESCIEDLNNKQKEAENKFEEIKTNIMDKFPQALDRRKAKNEEVKDLFEADRNKLVGQPLASNVSSDYDGSAGFVNFSEYKTYVEENPTNAAKQKFAQQPTRGPLIDEQELAQHNIDKYLNSVNEFKTKGTSVSTKLSSYLADVQKRTQKTDSSNGMLGAGAQAASGLSGLAKQAPAAVAATTSAGISGSAVSAVLPLAALGAAAAGSRSGSSSAGTLPSAPGTGAAAPTTPIVATTFGGERSPASAGINNKDPLKASEDKKTETPLIATVTPFSSDGSSRMGQLKRGNKNANSGSDDRISENHANTSSDAGIIPIGASHSSSHSATPPNDVTNLLGQMKSLFNFDEGGAGAGGPGGPDAAFGGAMPGAIPGLPVNGIAGAGPGETAAPASVAADGNPETVAEQAAGLASDTDSLFVRVHKRHVRYVQRGLLVVNLGGIR
jgi:hypothetical protein